MLLDTSHFAGYGDMNVILGIPRLREILMAASTKPPSIDISLKKGPKVVEQAKRLTRKLTRVTLGHRLNV